MKLKLPLGKKRTATLISAYAPTMTNPDDVKDKFYEKLEALISTVSLLDKLILLGNFNARVGKDHHAWEGVLGYHGIGKCNSNGLRLLKTCTAFKLIITNTLFCLPARNKTSWMHPRSRHWHLIDFIIVRFKDRQDVKVTKSMCGAECWTNHRVNKDLDALPSIDEVARAIKHMSKCKAPGPDAIPAEIFKSGGISLTRRLTDLFRSHWEKETLPQAFKDATIVHIYKRKGNKRTCDNHRGISLFSIAGKILARVFLNRLLKHLEQDHLPESQCGFRTGRETIDMIFAARQLQENSMEQRQDLYITFFDLNKAFDSVSRKGLWKILAKFGCPEKFVKMVRLFHDDMVARVLNDGGRSEPFQVTNGVKQGSFLEPTLFSMMFAAMLMEAFKDSSTGIPIRYRYDGNLFNLKRLQALSKVNETKIRDLLFADDCALKAATEQEMQREVDQFSSACDDFGLIINAQKRK